MTPVCSAIGTPKNFQGKQRGMSATFFLPSIAAAAASQPLRFGVEGLDGELSVRWKLARNRFNTSGQWLMFIAVVGMLSVGIGRLFWLRSAVTFTSLDWLDVIAVAAASTALWLHARHAADHESIHLQPGRLTVEHVSANHIERVEFAPNWVRVEPEQGDRSLVELTGEGRRIVVGRFVRPELRRQLADELRWALRRWHVMQATERANGALPHKFEN